MTHYDTDNKPLSGMQVEFRQGHDKEGKPVNKVRNTSSKNTDTTGKITYEGKIGPVEVDYAFIVTP